jgi:hypothetical protein
MSGGRATPVREGVDDMEAVASTSARRMFQRHPPGEVEALCSAGATGPGVSAFEGAAFVLGQSAPDSGVPAELGCPYQAGLNDLTATADDFCVFYLEKGGAGVPDREEELRVFV